MACISTALLEISGLNPLESSKPGYFHVGQFIVLSKFRRRCTPSHHDAHRSEDGCTDTARPPTHTPSYDNFQQIWPDTQSDTRRPFCSLLRRTQPPRQDNKSKLPSHGSDEAVRKLAERVSGHPKTRDRLAWAWLACSAVRPAARSRNPTTDDRPTCPPSGAMACISTALLEISGLNPLESLKPGYFHIG